MIALSEQLEMPYDDEITSQKSFFFLIVSETDALLCVLKHFHSEDIATAALQLSSSLNYFAYRIVFSCKLI